MNELKMLALKKILGENAEQFVQRADKRKTYHLLRQFGFEDCFRSSHRMGHALRNPKLVTTGELIAISNWLELTPWELIKNHNISSPTPHEKNYHFQFFKNLEKSAVA